jgi:hypothetical protein
MPVQVSPLDLQAETVVGEVDQIWERGIDDIVIHRMRHVSEERFGSADRASNLDGLTDRHVRFVGLLPQSIKDQHIRPGGELPRFFAD